MARAKNTSRAEARKRTRDDARAEIAAEQEPEDGAEATATTTTEAKKRRSGVLFKWPDVPADVRSIGPQFRTKKLLWVPFLLILLGFVLNLVLFGLPAELQSYIALYLQFFFNPAALFTYFIAGFLATRASYLFGGMAGLLMGVLIITVYLIVGGTVDPTTGQSLLSGTDLAFASISLILQTTFIGAAAGGFAGWYRDFLRRMQDNSRAKQTQREQEAKEARRNSRQESRKAAKQRSTS